MCELCTVKYCNCDMCGYGDYCKACGHTVANTREKRIALAESRAEEVLRHSITVIKTAKEEIVKEVK
ncbi:MAG: hypothetical protein QXL94_01525 [Candidatus Parvarchaeum sp.]